jgi:hypothetical protein
MASRLALKAEPEIKNKFNTLPIIFSGRLKTPIAYTGVFFMMTSLIGA